MRGISIRRTARRGCWNGWPGLWNATIPAPFSDGGIESDQTQVLADALLTVAYLRVSTPQQDVSSQRLAMSSPPVVSQCYNEACPDCKCVFRLTWWPDSTGTCGCSGRVQPAVATW